MSVLTINAFPSTATITATYNEETITGIGQVVIEANDSTVVSYTVEAQQCTSKSGTFTISGDMTEAVALNYIGSVSVDTWVPSTGRDTFPTHIAMLGKGGWRSVESNDERDAIPSARREAGMSVYVTSEKKLYILNSDLVTWSLFSAGGVIEMPTPSETELNNIVQYIGETTEDYTQGYFYKCISDGAEPATYSWERIDVQPHQDISGKLDKVTDQTSVVYGVDENGNQTTYNMTAFGQIDNVAVHGVDQTITDKRVDLSVVEQLGSLPLASEDLVGRVVQYTGGDTQDLVHNYFYECKPIYTDETRVVKSASSQLTASADLDTFAQSGLEYNTQYLYEKHGAHWDCIDPEGITITGPRAGLVLSGVVNTNDQVILEVDREFVWEQVDVQPNPEVYESFFRGRWATWTTVPTDTSLYPEDYHGNRVPKNNDYMVIEDASDYVSEPSPTVRVETKSTSAGAAIITVTNIVNGQTVDIVHTSASGEIQLFDNDVYITYSSPYWSIYSKNAPIVINDVIYPVGTKYRWSYSSVVDFVVNTSITNLSGAWRFAYHGEWDTDSKNGWLPEYQLENVLPIATDTEPGITKIYSTTGQNTDGTMTQKSITDALDTKQNELTAGTNITIEEDTQTGELVISSKAQETFFRGRWDSWNAVPTDASLYPVDIHGNHKPLVNDFLVVTDASGYQGDYDNLMSITIRNTGDDAAYPGFSYTFIENGSTIKTVTYPSRSSSEVSAVVKEGMYITLNRPGYLQCRVNFYSDAEHTQPLQVKYNNNLVSSITSTNISTSITEQFYYANLKPLEGSWRFYYDSNYSWDIDGKLGWKPQYQVEETLPDATDQEKGIAKLYTTTGQNTDGSVTQKLVTDELGKKQDTLTPGTGIDISTDASTGKLVISSTSSESFYRGTFNTWALVPTNPTSYVEDPVHHLKTPTNTDYMIVTDASDYYKPGDEITIQARGYIGGVGYVLDISGKWEAHLTAYDTAYERVYGNNELIVKFEANGYWGWRIIFNTPVVLNGIRYDNYDEWTIGQNAWTRVFNEIVDQPCEGTWRFGYYGEWDTAGRNGWVAEYKIEDTLPIATDTVAGITKLYTDLGENTDGAVDQATVTTELSSKQDVLTASTGIEIDENSNISTNNIIWKIWPTE